MRVKLLFGFILLISSEFLSCKKEPDPQPPKASFTYSYSAYTVTFKNTSETYGSASTYTWDFGDGTPYGIAESPTHTYGGAGIHYVTLVVSNAYGYSKCGVNIEIKEEIAKISTRFGDMYIWLYNETPNHKLNFLQNADSHLYDSTIFHKIVPGEMIIGGDYLTRDTIPRNDGQGGTVSMMPEFNDSIYHTFGAIGAVRPPDAIDPQKKSNNWQFYIITNPSGYSQWNGNHTVFGQIIKGTNVAAMIGNQQADTTGRPIRDIRMSVSILRLTRNEIWTDYGYKPRR